MVDKTYEGQHAVATSCSPKLVMNFDSLNDSLCSTILLPSRAEDQPDGQAKPGEKPL